jgi:cytoskeletal protein RodZ
MATETPRRRRHSPAVYRRRRIVLLVALLAIVAVVWLLIAQPWRGSAAQPQGGSSNSDDTTTDAGVTELPVPKDGSSTPSAASTPSATPSATPSGKPASTPSSTPAAAPCHEGDIAVEALTDKESYASGQNPLLSIKLTNNGATACTLNVGTSSQVFTITSGSDTWWRSTDCQTEPSDMIVSLAAGQSVKSAVPLTWDRTRSSVSTCSATDRPRAPGGGASYHVTVEIGGVPSSESAQILLY